MSQNRELTEPLHSEKVYCELERGKKVFYLDLKENDRGQLIRVKEVSAHGVNFILIPAQCGQEFSQALVACLEAAEMLREK